jgi:hypothetical protein
MEGHVTSGFLRGYRVTLCHAKGLVSRAAAGILAPPDRSRDELPKIS